MVESSL